MPATATQTETARHTALVGLLAANGVVSPAATVARMRQLQGGWSRQSYVAQVDDPGREPLECVVRVRPPGALLDTDLGQEFRVFALLQDHPLPSPAVFGLEEDPDNAFGGPYFVMERLYGEAPNVWNGRGRTLLDGDWAGPRGIATDMLDNLIALHSADAAAAPDIPLQSYGATVDRWEGVWLEHRLMRDPVVEEAFVWARDREPAPVRNCVVHGDYRIGNCLVRDARVTGILDWELAHVGDPRFDLGYMSLDYQRGKFAKPGSTLLGGFADEDWFFTRYSDGTGIPVDRATVDTFSVVGALMLTAIMTTGIRVYSDRGSDDIRMLWSRFVLPGLRQDMAALMGWGS